jgi:hypothetical protein
MRPPPNGTAVLPPDAPSPSAPSIPVSRPGRRPAPAGAVLRRFAPLLLLAGAVRAAFDEPPPGAIAAGNGGVRISASGPEAVLSDPCGIGSESSPAFGASSAFPYGLAELACHGAALVWPTRLGSLGAGLRTTGGDAYRESAVALVWSAGLRSAGRFGLRLRYLSLSIARYGSWNGAAVDASVRVRLDPAWSFGGSAENLNGAAPEKGRPPVRVLSAGLLFEPAAGWCLSAETGQTEGRPPEWRFGGQARAGSACVFRAGCSRGPSRLSFGLGLRKGPLETDYACTIHPVLGAIHRMDVVLRPGAGRQEPGCGGR